MARIVAKEIDGGDRVMVGDTSLSAPLVREDGVWRRGIIHPDVLEDYCWMGVDGEEAEALFQEAKAALEADPERFKKKEEARA
jgi:hypothetical protein